MNTIENNKLIMDFMKLLDLRGLTNFSWSDAPFFYCNEDSKEKLINSVAKYVKYSTSFDWIMKVVEKIESLTVEQVLSEEQTDSVTDAQILVSIEGNMCQIMSNGYYLNEIVTTEGGTKIEATYNAVVEFIKWYNQQNK